MLKVRILIFYFFTKINGFIVKLPKNWLFLKINHHFNFDNLF